MLVRESRRVGWPGGGRTGNATSRMVQAMQDSKTLSQSVPTEGPARGAGNRKVRRLLLVNFVMFAVTGLVAEAGFRWFWHPRYWVHGEGWLVGSGEDRAGRKWWPNADYRIEGKEFRVRFRSDGRGYRARPEPPRTADPIRIAFVGDSFTEAKQVEYNQSFVALLEDDLTACAGGREVVSQNMGIAGTGFFDYWHRITHDVFCPGTPPPAGLVLCIYPGNDFTDYCPGDGFEPDGRPRREYFGQPTWPKHALTWLNLKSKLAFFVVHTLKMNGFGARSSPMQVPRIWWNDPALAASAGAEPGVRRIRGLMQAIEQECDRHRTRLVIVIVGPVKNYAAKDGQSPLAEIFSAWGIKAPVIDVAIKANATERPSRFVFFHDSHLNPQGHRFLADTALGPISQALGFPTRETALRDEGRTSNVTR
jgi:hypothetical protein